MKQEAEEIIGHSIGPVIKKPWITASMLEMMDQRRQWKHQTTEEARQQYRKLNNKLCKVTQRAKEVWWAQKCEEIEELDKQGKQDQMYKAINDMNRKKSRSSISIKDENGKLISDPELVRNRWKEYIEKLYNAEDKPHSLNF